MEDLHGYNPTKEKSMTQHPDGPDYAADDLGPLGELAERAHKNSVEHGFWPDEHEEKEALQAITGMIDEMSPTFDRPAGTTHALTVLGEFIKAKGGRNFGEMIALIHSEASEALEEHRADDKAFYMVPQAYGPDKPEGTLVELIDVIIRCLDTAGDIAERTGIKVDDVMEAKMTFNESRPHKHGKKF